MTESTQPQEARKYEGTPQEVGAMLAVDALGPTINQAMDTQPPGQVAKMIAGMIAGLVGMVAENYGPDAAHDMLVGTAENLAKNMGAFGGPSH